tara:strand:- start:3041 stop:3412 length:372 start_codon:yes stop_codon:yes gene_type:complete
MNYNDWKYNVNKIVFNEIGYYCDDIEDYTYADSYNKNISSEKIANTIISIFNNNKEYYYIYNNKYHYNIWKNQVNMIIKNKISKCCDELNDFNYLECYNEDLSPNQVAYHIINKYNDNLNFNL